MPKVNLKGKKDYALLKIQMERLFLGITILNYIQYLQSVDHFNNVTNSPPKKTNQRCCLFLKILSAAAGRSSCRSSDDGDGLKMLGRRR